MMRFRVVASCDLEELARNLVVQVAGIDGESQGSPDADADASAKVLIWRPQGSDLRSGRGLLDRASSLGARRRSWLACSTPGDSLRPSTRARSRWTSRGPADSATFENATVLRDGLQLVQA